MKKQKTNDLIEIVLGDDQMKCNKCLHIRENEPYAKKTVYVLGCIYGYEHTCWRCCRDGESTLLIKQKWPLAFDRYPGVGHWRLAWSPGVKELVGENEKA